MVGKCYLLCYVTQHAVTSSCPVGGFLLLPGRAELQGKWPYGLLCHSDLLACGPFCLWSRGKGEHPGLVWPPETWPCLLYTHRRSSTHRHLLRFWLPLNYTPEGPGLPFSCPSVSVSCHLPPVLIFNLAHPVSSPVSLPLLLGTIPVHWLLFHKLQHTRLQPDYWWQISIYCLNSYT